MLDVIRLRQATLGDAPRLCDWRNEADTRAASFNTEPIAYEDHIRWFQEKMQDHNVRFLIAVDADNRDVGYARLDISGDAAEINLGIDKHQRGKGIGSALIRAVTAFAIDDLKVRCVVARIKTGNAASAAAFRRAGFMLVGRRELAGADSIEMVYEPRQ